MNQVQRGDDKQYNMHKLSGFCSMYQACPICFKCENKASHLYLKCQSCPIQFDGHNHKHKSWAIRRDNFAINVSEETMSKFDEARDRVHSEGK